MGDSPIIFTSDAVTSENNRWITARVTTNIDINGSPYIFFYFLHDFRVLKHRIIDENSHRLIAAPLLWYCDVTQTLNVTSFGPIIIRTFSRGSHASSQRRQADYHSLIIENYSRRFHWLVCKKFEFFIISRKSDEADAENISSWKTTSHLSCMTNTMTADVLATQWVRVLIAMILT